VVGNTKARPQFAPSQADFFQLATFLRTASKRSKMTVFIATIGRPRAELALHDWGRLQPMNDWRIVQIQLRMSRTIACMSVPASSPVRPYPATSQASRSSHAGKYVTAFTQMLRSDASRSIGLSTNLP
jgi:hypothetical protein